MILIQHSTNKTFFAGPKAWVTDPGRSLTFPTPLNAIAYALEHRMKGVQVMVTREGRKPVVEPFPKEERAEAD